MKLSIITINYNNRDGLRKTIESVVNQTCKEFQYIVIDGGSIDGSVEVIKEFADRIDYWISEPDRGVYHAMNKGIDKAEGEYCIFMNSGDCFYDESVIESIYEELDGTEILYGDTKRTDGTLVYSSSFQPSMEYFLVDSFAHQSTIIKTSLFQKYKYDERLKIMSDLKFFIQTVIIGNCSCKTINRIISIYDLPGISSINNELHNQERIIVLNSLFPKRILKDLTRSFIGENQEDKLYLDIKRSKYHSFFYKVIVFIISFMSFFKKGDKWKNKYSLK